MEGTSELIGKFRLCFPRSNSDLTVVRDSLKCLKKHTDHTIQALTWKGSGHHHSGQ